MDSTLPVTILWELGLNPQLNVEQNTYQETVFNQETKGKLTPAPVLFLKEKLTSTSYLFPGLLETEQANFNGGRGADSLQIREED